MTAATTVLFDLPTLTVRRAVVSEMANNAYLLTHKHTGEQLLIDAAADAPALTALLADGATDATVPTTLTLIATTHQHWDHIRALAELVTATGAHTAAGADDLAGIAAGAGVRIDQALSDGDRLTSPGGSLVLDCVALRGHTPGSIAFVLNGSAPSAPAEALAGAPAEATAPTVIFSGDSLFPGGVGNTNGDATRFASLLDDVTDRLFGRYPDTAHVLPGHGAATTLGTERPALADWRARGW